MATLDRPTETTGRLRLALLGGAAVWLALLVVGFFAPGGWTWGMAGPIGHIENYVISLWFAVLVVTPTLAARDPVARTPAIQAYLLGILAIVVSTIRGEQLKLISDAPPLLAAALTAGAAIWTYPRPAVLWRF